MLRLDPLSERQVKDMLKNRHGVADADGFIAAARVDRLLRNHQNLDMLAKSVSRGEWPDSRKETFDQACQMLVRETNGEHLTRSETLCPAWRCTISEPGKGSVS